VQRCVSVNETTQPASTDAPKTKAPPTEATSPLARVADVDEGRSAFRDNAGGRDGRWNEHEYYVKARSDLQKHHHEKVAKVVISNGSIRVFCDCEATVPKCGALMAMYVRLSVFRKYCPILIILSLLQTEIICSQTRN